MPNTTKLSARRLAMSTAPSLASAEALPRLEEIAREHTGFQTLVSHGSDEVDFRTVSVWDFRKALQAAFEAGRASR
jgi:hypothetical protein